jgi:hypothetical protein
MRIVIIIRRLWRKLTTILVAYIFVLLAVVSEKTATRVVYFDIILYSFGDVVGNRAPRLHVSRTPLIASPPSRSLFKNSLH